MAKVPADLGTEFKTKFALTTNDIERITAQLAALK